MASLGFVGVLRTVQQCIEAWKRLQISCEEEVYNGVLGFGVRGFAA